MFCNRKICHNDKIAFIPSRHNNGNKSGYYFDKKLSYIHFSSCFTLMRFTVYCISHRARSFEQGIPIAVFSPSSPFFLLQTHKTDTLLQLLVAALVVVVL